MGINPISFSRYMDPQHFMNQWPVTKNGTYLADARLLARLEHKKDITRGVGAKIPKRAGGGGRVKCKLANAPDATDVVINPTKRDDIEESEDERNRKNRGQ
jgi:hypothetical protein